MTTDNRCVYIYPDNHRCRAYRLRDSLYCINHDPDIDRTEIQTRNLPSHIVPDEITQSPVHVKKFLGRLIVDTLRGKVKPMTCNAITNATDKVLKCIQYSDLDTKMTALLNQLQGSRDQIHIQDMDCFTVDELAEAGGPDGQGPGEPDGPDVSGDKING